MRLSALQRETLALLYQVYQQIGDRHFPCVKLFEVFNSSRPKEVFPNNFRVSYRKLEQHGLIELIRDEKKLTLSARLTEEGKKQAEIIHQHRSTDS